MLCTNGTSRYLVELYATSPTLVDYRAQFDEAVRLTVSRTTSVISNGGYCGNLHGRTVWEALASGLAW